MVKVLDQVIEQDYCLYNGDSVEVMRGLPHNSIHYSIFSPPFASLYTYSNSNRDLGNSKTRTEFYKHFQFIISELHRVLKPGCAVSVHCMDLPLMKERDGYIGLSDFPGKLTVMFEDAGFIYHSKAVIWKDPLMEATRTKAIGLLHKQIKKDSSICRNGLPDYLITFRKHGQRTEPVEHPDGFTQFIGIDEPRMQQCDDVYSQHVWRRYASPIWMDINQSRTLNRDGARENADERHICPLQLDVIARGIELYSNPRDTILTPFMGIGSEVYQAILMGRKGIGIELKQSYFLQAIENCKQVEFDKAQMSLFD